METLWQDVRFGWRMLCKSPVFTGVAVISLALGIGAGTATFSIVNAILLSSLPVPNPQELRILNWSGGNCKFASFTGAMYDDGPGRQRGDSVSYPLFQALREQCAAQADIATYATLYSVTIRARREAFSAEGLMVSDNYFSLLGLRPLLGRLTGAEDERPGANPAIFISHQLWQREFDLDPGVVGQSVTVNGSGFIIAGVLPPAFSGSHPGARTDFYVSMSAQPQLMPDWPRTLSDRWWTVPIARLKPGVSDTQFQAALNVVFIREAASTMKEPKIVVSDGRAGPGQDRQFYRKPLLLLLGICGIVLLVACANLAGLTLARGAARRHEFAVRGAIGAGRGRLLRQSLTESLLVAMLGCGLGVLLALWGKTAIGRLLDGSQEGLSYDTSLDLKVLGFALVVAVVVGIVSGLLPALRAANIDPLCGLKDSALSAAPRLRAGRFLVASQIALSLLLLTAAGLYARTLVNLVRINPGFRTENLLLFEVNPRIAGYKGAQAAEFFDKVQLSLAAIPGVRSAALTEFAMLNGWMSGGGFLTLPGRPATDAKPNAHRLVVSETFFITMGIPMVLGRELSATDIDGSPKVVVVNETFARKYLSGENPVGQMLNAYGADWRIAGVCRDIKYTDIKSDSPPTVYFSFRQNSVGRAYFALRTYLSPLSVVAAARKVVSSIDRNIPLTNIGTQEQVRDKKISQERMFATLCGALAVLAILLSCIGLYGLMAYNVARRTREIGVRMALGATRGEIARPVLREALLLVVLGIAGGVPLTYWLTRIIRSSLFGVEPFDPVTYCGAMLLLIFVAVCAAWIPARRAAKVEPIVALRCE